MQKVRVKRVRPADLGRNHKRKHTIGYAVFPIMSDCRWNTVARAQAVRALTAQGIEATDNQIAAYFETLRARLCGAYPAGGAL